MESTETKISAKTSKGSAKEVTTTETKYTLLQLRKSCLQLFGISPSTFDGVTSGLSGEYTIAEMQGLISTWNEKSLKEG